jgi:hypothetical protein
MATRAVSTLDVSREDRFFLRTVFVMAAILVAGFSVQFLAGRSTFAARPLVHLHALAFFGWVAIFTTQTWLGTHGSVALHRQLGWIGAGWMVVLVVLGTALTVDVTQRGSTPFFFQPQHFLIANPFSVLCFAGLSSAAIVMRRRTDWHKRLHICGMAMLMGPGFGRLLPMPLLMPYAYQIAALAGLVFPLAGMVFDRRANNRVHPAWLVGSAAIVLTIAATGPIVRSDLGAAIYRATVADTPGQFVAPLEFGTSPKPK